MKKIIILCASFGIFVAAGALIALKVQPDESPIAVPAAELQTDHDADLNDDEEVTTEEENNEDVEKPSDSGSENQERTYIKSLPTLEAYRQEVGEIPNATPRSLIVFATKMAEDMEEALQSEIKSIELFKNLDLCLTQAKERSLPAIQVSCLVNARRLADRFPKALGPSYASLRQEAPRDVVQMANAFRWH